MGNEGRGIWKQSGGEFLSLKGKHEESSQVLKL